MSTQTAIRELPQGLGELWQPTRPNDHLSFHELASRYNFQQTSTRTYLFTRLLAEECAAYRHPVRALDIGCGQGIGRKPALTRVVANHIDELWGLEPDESVLPEEGIFTNFQHALMETAVLPENYFDVVYSFMVVEHVADARGFLQAVHRCLKPGGVHFFMTINGAHYFALIASTLKRLMLDELVLRIVRGKEVDEYHYPVQYRLNTPRIIDRTARLTGFDPPEYVFLEEEGPAPYFPGPLRPVMGLFDLKRKLWKNPRSLLTLLCRMRKSYGDAPGLDSA